MEFKYYSVKEINKFLESKSLAVNKNFGQNFLINSGVCDTIVNNLSLQPEDVVFEIGCGLGSLTNRLIDSPVGKVVGFEIDNAYIKHLKKLFKDYDKFSLYEGDFLKVFAKALDENVRSGQRLIITGNLPYYITTPILDAIFTKGIKFERAAFMMQKEVAERITSGEGNKKYGSLSIFCQYYSRPKIIAKIGPGSFYPRPNVDSAVILFESKPFATPADDEKLFFKVARSLFINRRKQLKNNFQNSPFLSEEEKSLIAQAMENVGIPPEERGERLSIARIVELSNALLKLKGE